MCPDGTYDNGNPICPTCQVKCQKCSEKADKCVKCAENRLNEPTCGCPDGYFDDGFSS